MAKIATTRLPDATPEYQADQFNALIRILEQITQQLNFGFQQDIKDESTARSVVPWSDTFKSVSLQPVGTGTC